MDVQMVHERALAANGWENSPGAKLPKTAPGPGSRDRSSRGAAGGVDGGAMRKQDLQRA